MSKKTNTLVFILGATVFNIIITIICFLVLMVIYSKFFYFNLPEDSVAWALPVIFLASIVASFFVYRVVVKLIMKKVDLEEHFDPIFGRRPPPRKHD